jgi:hypothetical protein
MTDEPVTRTPWRPTTDLMLIVISAIIIGIGLWMMAPF